MSPQLPSSLHPVIFGDGHSWPSPGPTRYVFAIGCAVAVLAAFSAWFIAV